MSTAHVPALRTFDPFGFPDADAWEGAEILAPLVRAQDGGTPRVATIVRVGRAPGALHVRFESDGDAPRCSHVRRGSPLWEESVVEVFVALGGDTPARYLEIEVNPAAAIFDASVANPGGDRSTMQVDTRRTVPDLSVRVGRPSTGRWTAEISIPWRALATEAELPDTLRANFYRIHRAPGEAADFSAWSPTFVEPADFHRPERFGRLILRRR
jgi:Carbohydrate-binding family 9